MQGHTEAWPGVLFSAMGWDALEKKTGEHISVAADFYRIIWAEHPKINLSID